MANRNAPVRNRHGEGLADLAAPALERVQEPLPLAREGLRRDLRQRQECLDRGLHRGGQLRLLARGELRLEEELPHGPRRDELHEGVLLRHERRRVQPNAGFRRVEVEHERTVVAVLGEELLRPGLGLRLLELQRLSLTTTKPHERVDREDERAYEKPTKLTVVLSTTHLTYLRHV